jgi:hypothetical protein
MTLMQNYFIFDEPDLEKIGLICPNCNTESVFDLSKDQTANVPRDCPGCGNAKFVESFMTEVKASYNWITWYKKVREIKKSVGIRFYFKREN